MSVTERLVLDGSVALAWCFTDEQNDYADAVARVFPGLEAVVPSLWHLEVANALLMGERRGRSTRADTVQWMVFLSALPVSVDAETSLRAWDDILELARSHGLTTYDASYLELALRLSLPLATLDGRLKAAAGSVGVPLYEPGGAG
jgi:predicted nucleic acid-binding protein